MKATYCTVSIKVYYVGAVFNIKDEGIIERVDIGEPYPIKVKFPGIGPLVPCTPEELVLLPLLPW
jgi:hypothetical protein